jgi:hypothetical protein
VTPVIFFWIRERRLGLQHEAVAQREGGPMSRRNLLVAAAVIAITGAAATLVWRASPPTGDSDSAVGSTVIQTVQAGELDVVLLAPAGALHQGRNTFTIEFRRAGTTTLVDAGTVRASANMPMPGMVMSGGMQVTPTAVPGRYSATAEFGMAGAWQMAIEWNGPAGAGSVNFEGGVQ